jgi:hypothetical protein
MRLRALRAALALLLLAPAASLAHKPSDAYLTLAPEGDAVAARLDVALRDLEQAVGLDADGDGRITWGELRARADDVDAYVLGRLELAGGGGRCPARVIGREVDRHADGAYAVLRLRAECAPGAQALRLRYALLFDLDPQHRGLVRWGGADGARSAILAADRRTLTLDPEPPAPGRELLAWAREGVRHIAEGFDHLLFVTSLLLPAALRRERGGWVPRPALRPALAEVARVVTAFTAAHSLSLGAAALGLVSLPSRGVESAIAASVVVAAANNVVPLWSGRAWQVALGFGLVHGLGFASVLAELGFARGPLAARLLGFNLGVEAGQLAVVACLLPILHGLRTAPWYRRLALPVLSCAIAALAACWLAERSLGVALL